MTINLNLKLVIDYKTNKQWEDPHIRIISKWTNCITTEIMKEGITSWIIDGDPIININDKKTPLPILTPLASRQSEVIGNWKQENIHIKLENDEDLNQFNTLPFITAIVMGCFEQKIKMITFVTIDCSPLLLHGGSVTGRSPLRDGTYVDFKIESTDSLIPNNRLIPFEPLELNFDSFDCFPVEEDINPTETLKSSYLYGLFDFGEFQRIIFGYPQGDQCVNKSLGDSQFFRSSSNINSTDNIKVPQVQVPIQYRSCILSGLKEKLKFQEKLTTSTYIIQIYTDELCDRIFTTTNISNYNEKYMTKPVIPEPQVQKQPSPRGNKKPAGKAGASPTAAAAANNVNQSAIQTNSLVHPISEVYQEKDDVIWNWISTALSNSPKILSYGSMRLRLESILETSTDRLLEFQKTRSGQDNSNLNIVVSDEKTLPVLPTRPSQPPRWHMPEDISLKSALQKSKEEKLQRTLQLNDSLNLLTSQLSLSDNLNDTTNTLNQTMNTTSTSTKFEGTQNSTQGFLKKKKKLKLYELYKDCGTVLQMQISLHRKYHHPEQEVSILPQTPQTLQINTPSQPPKPPGSGTSSNQARSIAKSKAPPAETALERKLRITPYARMVFIFRYEDNETLKIINDAIAAVNSKALPDIQGTLRSYSFSKEEIQSANDGELDVVCGFTIIDDETRMIVIEGLGGIGLGMQNIFADIPRKKENDKNLTILCNPEVLFSHRLYTEFGPDLKRVRPREKLKKLAKKPEIYNRKQVDIECFEAIDKLMILRTCPDLKTTKELDCYPLPYAIEKLELLYGDALSKQDLDGKVTTTTTTTQSNEGHETVTFGKSQIIDSKGEIHEASLLSSPSNHDFPGATLNSSSSLRPSRGSRLQATDCHNPVFEEHLRNRDPNVPRINRLEEQRNIRKAAWAQALNRLAQREEEDNAIIAKVLGESGKHVKIHCYSGQSQNFTELLKKQNRKELSTIKGSTFTYSQEFLSQSVSLVDEEADRKAMKEQEKSNWTTKRGFQYPPIKTRKELIQHPKRPHEARIEDLQQPFEDFSENRIEDPYLKERENTFQIPAIKSEYFGMLNPPVYSHEFELKNIGNRTKLPRGNLVAGKDQNELFWQSVHLSGEASAKLQEEIAEAEKKEWRDKVVVDTIDFKVGGFKVRDKPLQLDRTKDILKDEPKEKSLIHLRNMKTESGKDISFAPTPLTIMNTGEYVPNAMEKSLLRSENPDQFITTLKTGTATDFTRYIHTGTNKPAQQNIISKKKHPQLNPSEKHGPKWDPAS